MHLSKCLNIQDGEIQRRMKNTAQRIRWDLQLWKHSPVWQVALSKSPEEEPAALWALLVHSVGLEVAWE